MAICKIVVSENPSFELSEMVAHLIEGFAGDTQIIDAVSYTYEENAFKNCKVVFAIEVNQVGASVSIDRFLLELMNADQEAFSGSVGAMLIRSESDLFTKSYARHCIFVANRMGLSFLGHGAVEAVKGFSNYETWQKTVNKHLDVICYELCSKLGGRVKAHEQLQYEKPNILVLHASSNKISNTLMLWDLVSKHMLEDQIETLHVENGTVVDCKGCSFKTCVHFSEHMSCFYGGQIVNEVLPAIEKADIIVWICPNYNDSISAKLMAVINRMTVLYRRMDFYEKMIYSVVVSGNSGSDSVNEQLIGSLVINKGFFLPSKFSIMGIANDPGVIMQIPDIEKDAEAFGKRIASHKK